MAGNRSIQVTLRANVQDFKAQFDAASQAAERTSKSTEDAGRRAETAMGRMVQSATQNRDAWSTAGTAASGFGAAVLGVGVMVARTGVAYNQLQQRAGAALDVLMGSAEAAAAQMAKLNAFADNSPFSREIFIEAQQQLIAFGVEAERVVPILSAVQDAVAATGGSNQDISELVRILAQVTSTGKVTAETLNQLGYRGVDAATIIGEQMGKTGAQIRDEITAGTLDADAAIQALTDGMSERFGGAAAGVKETFDGAVDRVRAAWRDLSAELMVPLVSPDGGGLLIDLANGLADLMRSVESMPTPVRNAAAAMTGLTGAASLGAGAFLILLPRILDTIEAGKVLANDFPRVAGALGSVARGAARLSAVIGVAGVATIAIQQVTDAIRDIDRASFDLDLSALTNAIREGSRSGDMFTSTLGDMYDSGVLNTQMFDDLGGSITEVSNINWFQNLIGPLAATGINEAKDRLTGLGDAFRGLAETDLAQAQDAFAQFYDEAIAGGATFGEIMEVMPGFREALVGIALDAGLATDDATLLRIATGQLTPEMLTAAGAALELADGTDGAAAAAQEAADATDDYRNSLFELAGAFIDAERGMLDYAEALESANKLADENSGVWEDGTQAARDNKNELLDLAEQAMKTAESLSAENLPTGTFLEQAREDLIDVAEEMMGSREAAEAYVDQILLTPEEITTLVNLETEEAKARWSAIYAELWPEGGHPPMVIDPEVDPDGKVPAFTGILGEIPPETTADVDVDTDDAIRKTYGFGEVLAGETADQEVTVTADIEPAQGELNQLQTAINDSGGTVTINGNSTPGNDVLGTLMGIINSSDGTVTIDGRTVPAEEALAEAIRVINQSGGTVDIDGDPTGANRATDGAKRRADNTTGTMSVNANTSAAERELNRLARRRTAVINVSVTGNTSALRGSSMGRSMRAGGGPVFGPGTETSDSIPAQLSHNEHVWAAREVRAAGGHMRLANIRSQVLAGAKTIHLATGGAADGSVRAVPYMQAQMAATVGAGAPAQPGASPDALYAAVRAGMQDATVIAQVSDRVAANLHQRGRAASRAFGGAG